MPFMTHPRRIAIIHDWLTGMRGGEKVLELLCELFPQADLFTLVHIPGAVSPIIERHSITTSHLQRIPGIAKYYRHLLPFMPSAMDQFDFAGYDLLISTSHCVAKGAKPPANVPHICYCHTPMRYIWDQYAQYFGPGRTSLLVRLLMRLVRPSLQRWDLQTLPRVSAFIANSQNVKERIRRIYQRDAKVIYPPVDYNFYALGERAPDAESPFYLIVSALAPYKRIDLAIDCFTKNRKNLVIVGEGQEHARLRKSSSSNIKFVGWRSNAELRSYFQHCKALIFPGEEDFGIVPVEAMAAGCPVIAYRKGGALETIIENKTGVFFDEQTSPALQHALDQFEMKTWDASAIRAHAQTFSLERCAQELAAAFEGFV